MKICRLKKQKHGYLIHTSDKDFKDTVVNRDNCHLMHGGPLEITLSVSLIGYKIIIKFLGLLFLYY